MDQDGFEYFFHETMNTQAHVARVEFARLLHTGIPLEQALTTAFRTEFTAGLILGLRLDPRTGHLVHDWLKKHFFEDNDEADDLITPLVEDFAKAVA